MSSVWRSNSIIARPIDELVPYKNNPRKNAKSIEAVAESIKEFGFNVPIVIDKDNTIVTGHTRYEACKSLNFKEVPCIVADDLTEEQINAFRLADNKVAEFALWDYEKLQEEIASIKMDLSKFGIEEVTLDDIDLDSVLDDELKKGKVVICPRCGRKVAI